MQKYEPLMVFIGLLIISILLAMLIGLIPGHGYGEAFLIIIVVLLVVYFGMVIWAKIRGVPNPFERKD